MDKSAGRDIGQHDVGYVQFECGVTEHWKSKHFTRQQNDSARYGTTFDAAAG